MNESKIAQFQYENNTWKRLLDFIQSENVFLKNRLAAIASNDIGSDMLEEVEYFQNNFVGEDEHIASLRSKVAVHNRLLHREVFEDGSMIREVLREQKKMRKQVEEAEQRFNRLKFEFNNFLSDNL